MSNSSERQCPTCQGKKEIEGVCETSSEWQGTDSDDGMQCTPPSVCPTCNGSGVEQINYNKYLNFFR